MVLPRRAPTIVPAGSSARQGSDVLTAMLHRNLTESGNTEGHPDYVDAPAFRRRISSGPISACRTSRLRRPRGPRPAPLRRHQLHLRGLLEASAPQRSSGRSTSCTWTVALWSEAAAQMSLYKLLQVRLRNARPFSPDMPVLGLSLPDPYGRPRRQLQGHRRVSKTCYPAVLWA